MKSEYKKDPYLLGPLGGAFLQHLCRETVVVRRDLDVKHI
jgi:hypothetical protein